MTSRGKADCSGVHMLMATHIQASENQHDASYQQLDKAGYFPKELQVAFTKMLRSIALPLAQECPADPEYAALTKQVPVVSP
ncbi:MAG: hypothetical protein H7249_04665 [Chitinophagaceae bacterium]|nr:hypothetical protein [Oligoflexus sp.]